MYKFSLPDSFQTRTANKILLYAIREYRDWFYDDFVIENVYGSPNCCIWNGGRVINISGLVTLRPDEFFSSIVNMYRNKFDVSYRLTFTNCMLEPVHLVDTYANKFAEIMNNIGSKVIVSLPMMAEYLQTRYKNLEICWSTTTNFGKTIEEQINNVNKLSEKNIVVVPYWFNNKWDILGQLKYPENIELLANETCIDNCPRREQHYRAISKVTLYKETDEIDKEFYGCCPMQNKNPEIFEQPRKHEIKREMLNDYKLKGFNLFKLEGRLDMDTMNIANRYCSYFLKEEHSQNMTDFYNECLQTNFARFESF